MADVTRSSFQNRAGLFSHLGQDVLSSIVVFLVSLPLCLGISIATGYPPAAGLVSGIIGGLVVGALSGCPLQVSGPAAGLITVIWEAVQQFGVETVGVIVLLAGMLQIGIGFLGLGLWFRAVSPAVIQGMLAGIGLLIFSSQFHVMVDDTPKSSAIENLLSIPGAIEKGVFPLNGSVHHLAAMVGLVTIAVIALWRFTPKSWKWLPSPLVAVITAAMVAYAVNLPIKYVHVPDNLMDSLHFMSFSGDFLKAALANESIWVMAFTVAFIASAETLLTATAVDQISTKYRTHYNKEVMAQGVGNILAGVFGVLPITGVIVRSSANVQSGGQTRLATMIHGLWILVFALVFPFVLQLIPVAALAAILVYTGYKLMNVNTIKQLARFGVSEVLIYFATVVGIVATNLLEGVLIGLGLSLLKHFYVHSRLSIEAVHENTPHQTHLLLKGSASFVTLPRLATVLEKLPAGDHVVIHANHLSFIDHACIDFLENWEAQYMSRGGHVDIKWGGMQSAIPEKVPALVSSVSSPMM